jgi:hypothetical protein
MTFGKNLRGINLKNLGWVQSERQNTVS